jgi:hypothetical protein
MPRPWWVTGSNVPPTKGALVHSDPTKALDKIAEDTRSLEEGLETELKDDVEKAKGEQVRSGPHGTK